MSKEIKMLYKIYSDDLKDADMIMDYAEKLKEDNRSLADTMVQNAKARLSHGAQTYAEFCSTVKMLKDKHPQEVTECLIHVIDCMYSGWSEEIEEGIKKWK